MTTIDSLAHETLIDIFASVYDRRTLCKASLVCRRWCDPAQLALFSRVSLLQPHHADKWLASPARDQFKAREMVLGGTFPVEHVLKACEGLTSLDMWSSRFTYKSLLLPALAEIKQLHMWSPEHVVVAPADHGQLPAFRLTHLTLRLATHIPPQIFDLFVPSTSTLNSIDIVSLRPTNLPYTKSFFATNSFAIRHLTFSRDTPLHGILELLPLFPTLISLSFENITVNEEQGRASMDAVVSGIAAAVAHTLKELTFIAPGTEDAWVLEGDGSYLVGFIPDMLRALGVARLGNLKRLQLPDLTEGQLREARGGEEFLAECVRKGLCVFLEDVIV